jgi:hypothetical protein
MGTLTYFVALAFVRSDAGGSGVAASPSRMLEDPPLACIMGFASKIARADEATRQSAGRLPSVRP